MALIQVCRQMDVLQEYLVRTHDPPNYEIELLLG